VFSDAKRLFQQYPSFSDFGAVLNDFRFTPMNGHR